MIMKLICVLPLCHRPHACHRSHIKSLPAGCMPRALAHCADLCAFSMSFFIIVFVRLFYSYHGVCLTHFICKYTVPFTVVLMKICFSPISLTMFLPQFLPSCHGRAFLFQSLRRKLCFCRFGPFGFCASAGWLDNFLCSEIIFHLVSLYLNSYMYVYVLVHFLCKF